ncbi:integral membrane protein-like protein [Paraphoma chrysanthemicola]|uniref:Integral membrane protein-like protein n=1 Tax=Paraphoma chrysanthemicola TaxID=798071 RepID=A0A8K0QXG3_9PLEO|nr:integral membrane protein-like protein [Paraphoma chrysanthemicola]
MAPTPALDQQSMTSDLAADIFPWLRAVVVLGFISFFASVSLLFVLTYKLVLWQIKSKKSNQFVILIFNLLWADIQQALAFLLNVEWLRLGMVEVENPICFAQGWLVSTGDLGSGVWCFAIGLHTFASVILDYRLTPRYFYATIVGLWVFILGVSSIGIGLHADNLYVRSGVWCWIHHDLVDLRLWTHYVWIFIFEFGNVLIYLTIYTILLTRIRSGYYTPDEAKRVKSISNLMVVYPLVYVVCTIPLASARMAAMTGSPPSLKRLCLAGAMITSNGWLDVLLYTLTRRIMIFSDEPPAENMGIDTFAAFWAEKPKRFGGECTISAVPNSHQRRRGRSRANLSSSGESSDDLCTSHTRGLSSKDIHLVTTTEVKSEPAAPEDYEEMSEMERRKRPRSPMGRWSEESGALSFKMEELSRAGTPK